jgi:DNA repair exonuclease SbcCD ATPase subunit
MLKIKNITAKNFLSIGNQTQAVNFDRDNLTLVLGSNIDLGGDDAGSRNGTGKTSIINALSYAFYGQALTNIKKDNLINKTNGKNMLVTVDFECGNTSYRIERGRKPNVLKFFVNDREMESSDDNSQGDSRETQQEIERLINMRHDMFKHIVALNTYTEPFLSLKAADQRTIIEQLLGITLLSEKAEGLKEQIRITKDAIQQEEFRIKAVKDANTRIQEQIDSTKRRQKLWQKKHDDELTELTAAYDELLKLDIDIELASHKQLAAYKVKETNLTDLEKTKKSLKKDFVREEKTLFQLNADVQSLKDHKCHSCGQALHDDNHATLLERKETDLSKTAELLERITESLAEVNKKIDAIGSLGVSPVVFYDTESEAVAHKSSINHLFSQIEKKVSETDPYAEQITEMEKNGIEEVSYDLINSLTRVRDHQEFLLKLLTNKDSFIRKQIIDQNLNFLNGRLAYYLNDIELPHTVKFNNDLSVSIEELGRELDFDNLSRGERNRLILSLSWAFRDVWESLYQPINLLFIDELVDSGMDSSGVENSLKILKKMARGGGKSVWLISHKDELASRVNNIMYVVKESGFTRYSSDVEIVKNSDTI